MQAFRRDFLKLAGCGLAGGAAALLLPPGAKAYAAPLPHAASNIFDVRSFGATGDGKTIDTPAVNRAIDAAAAAGGGTVLFPAGTYACYSIRLKSYVALYIEEGATILAANTPFEGTANGYDAAEPNTPWEAFQDYGHNHWHNSLIWGENLHDIAILGPGLIWGKGLSCGRNNTLDPDMPLAESPGIGNKAIALKNCHNVILRDVSMLAGGHFAILATGVDNLTIDNLKIDTNRDGIDIDCCRNVRVSNCSVNSPWDDGICPKSSFALGYARATENVTISNCYVTGTYEMGTLLDGSFKDFGEAAGIDRRHRIGRIKCGTESNGGFKNITISNCIFEKCRGFALETVDGAILEDITFTGVTMRDIRNSPIYLRLGSRMRGPAGIAVGRLRRVIISNVTCTATQQTFPSMICGIPGHRIEDIKIDDLYVQHQGGGDKESAAIVPIEFADGYPEPWKHGPQPALGFILRHLKNAEFSNVEIASLAPDARPVFWMQDVDDVDFFRLTLPERRGGAVFQLDTVKKFRVSGSRSIANQSIAAVARRKI